MQLTAKLKQLLPARTVIGKNGIWNKQDIIVETDGQYPKNVCISIWGDKINEGQLLIGNLLQIDFDIESKEYKTKWYTEIKAMKIDVVVTKTQNAPDDAVNKKDFIPKGDDHALPF